ncbi:zinc ribbon domain-containing protein [Lentilactobacillus sp. Marseille-Q4993]|uniref:TcaA 3rd/4th domain-containing protein n=1 Tax=Lentilactobacillus sp. Marseille-Q4993 TaxID=3039492 RepID=UPI0024BC7D5A|nr:zinc ribbon domain-containing protein [Lentilactobacillus sp. Marseille-Q4993]
MQENFFCPNCGTKISKDTAFCPECGFNVKQYLLDQAKLSAKKEDVTPEDNKSTNSDEHEQPVNSGSSHQSDGNQQFQGSNSNRSKQENQQQINDSRQRQNKPRKPIKKWKVFVGVAVVAVIAGGYMFGRYYFGRAAASQRLISDIKNDDGKGVASFIKTTDPSFKATSDSVEPLIKYFSDNKDQLAKFTSAAKGNGYFNDKLQFSKSGSKFLLFDNYVLKAKTIYPKVKTNRDNAVLKLNNEVVSNKMGTTGYKKIGPYLPGEYSVQTSASVDGRKLQNNGKFNWVSSDDDDLQQSLPLETISYSVKGEPGAKVLLNGVEIGTVGSDGFYEMKNYPFSQDMQVSLSFKSASKKVLKSKPAKVTMDDNNGTVEPEFSGFANESDVSDLLNGIWGDIDDGTVTDEESADDDNYGDYFVGGTGSVVYQGFMKMIDGYQNDDNIDDYYMSSSVQSVAPYDTNLTRVVYNVKYKFELDDHTHIQVFQYHGLIQKQDDGSLKMKTNVVDKKVADYDRDDDD